MDSKRRKTLPYRRHNFVTQLPVDYRYSPSHCWLGTDAPGVWRVGLTKFAVRMLGEMVDHGYEVRPGVRVKPGQILGWVEGFKAISDLYCVGRGRFVGANPALQERITLINRDPYGAGWLYRFQGVPDDLSMDVHGYRQLLDHTIEKILERRKQSGHPD